MSHSHGTKCETTDEVFQEQCFLLERGASVGVDFDFTFKTLDKHKNLFYKTQREQ